jgi:hypothetical protein
VTPLLLNSDLRARQAAFNRSSHDQWEGFAEHRSHVTARLAEKASRGVSRLCVLGAGNANDLDLAALLALFREVHLVDLDADALQFGATRQGVAGRPSLHFHPRIDVTGMLDVMTSWTPMTPIANSSLLALSHWPSERVSAVLPGPFDVVASTCLISQLLETASHALGPSHRSLSAVLRALRVGHLRLLAELSAPAGTAFLISELASSQKVPELESWNDAELSTKAIALEREAHVFGGLDRSALLEILRGDSFLRGRVGLIETSSPWRWRLHERTYLTRSLSFQRIPVSS